MIRRLARFLVALLLAGSLAAGAAVAQGQVSGTVTADDGEPLAKVEIRLIPVDRTDLPVQSAKTRKDGTYIFGLVRKATYRVAAIERGYRVAGIGANIALPEDDSVWAYDGPLPPGSEPPKLAITGLTVVSYDIRMVPDEGDPGEWGTGQPLLTLDEMVAFIEAGDVDSALREIRRGLTVNPENARLHYLRGFGLFAKGKTKEALAAAETALELDPQLEGVQTLRGRILQSEEKPDEAVEAYLAEADTATELAVRKEALVAAALLLEQQKDLDRASETLEKLVAAFPEDVVALRELANVYLQLGEKEKAEAILVKVSEMGGTEDPAVLYNLGAQAFNNSEFDKAVDYFSRAVEIQPEFAEAYLRLGYARLNTGDVEGAVEALGRFVELQPDSPQAEEAQAILQSLTGS
jgi:tetratricopeptide (TPR) repeat protein